MQLEELYRIFKSHPQVQTDTRKLKAGDLFFALKGQNFDGNQFAQKAVDAGAAYAVVDDASLEGEKFILVPDVLQTLQALARHHRQQFSIPFIAITGSNGKTTTKELVHAVLASHYHTYTTEGNLNNHIGVPLTLLKIRPDAEMAVIEMGANHQKEIASYCEVALPTHGLITNCGKAHLEGFGGVEGVRKGKGELFDYLRKAGGTAFIMNDYDYLHQMSDGIKQVVQYGTADGTVVGKEIETDPFLVVDFKKGLQQKVKTQLVGAYNLPNVLAAVTIGLHFNVPEEKIARAIGTYVPSNSRSQLVKKGTNTIVLDAYNANPSSMVLAVENMASMPHPASEKVLVLGAMAELGDESPAEHRALVNLIEKSEWKDVILVGNNFAGITSLYNWFESAAAAGEYLKSKNYQSHTFLIKGSRSMQMEKVLDYL